MISRGREGARWGGAEGLKFKDKDKGLFFNTFFEVGVFYGCVIMVENGWGG